MKNNRTQFVMITALVLALAALLAGPAQGRVVEGTTIEPSTAVDGGTGIEVVAAQSDGFEWGSFGIGLAAGLGMLLLASTAVFLLHSRQRRPAAIS
jgi:hypothetical protein